MSHQHAPCQESSILAHFMLKFKMLMMQLPRGDRQLQALTKLTGRIEIAPQITPTVTVADTPQHPTQRISNMTAARKLVSRLRRAKDIQRTEIDMPAANLHLFCTDLSHEVTALRTATTGGTMRFPLILNATNRHQKYRSLFNKKHIKSQDR